MFGFGFELSLTYLFPPLPHYYPHHPLCFFILAQRAPPDVIRARTPHHPPSPL